MSSGKAGRVVVVVHESAKEGGSLGLSDDFRRLAENMEEEGFKRDQFRIMECPSDHPVTLKGAEIVVSDLTKEGVRSAILVSEGFHTRRSYWVYKQEGAAVGIEIIPRPYFYRYRETFGGWNLRAFTLTSCKSRSISIMLQGDIFR